MRQRGKIVPKASGIVLDLGFGTGRNLDFYDPDRVDRIWALDPSVEMWELASEAVDASPLQIEYLEAPGEAIPLDDDSIDSVVVTYSLCTIPDPHRALEEASRVMKRDGRLFFCEHGKAPDLRIRQWQSRLNPIWKRLGGGCHLDRPIPSIVENSGFESEQIESMYIPGWKPASYNYWGTARPA